VPQIGFKRGTAVTIDFGDMEIVKALVRAGADPSIRNNDGCNAREQARYSHHAQIEEALRYASLTRRNVCDVLSRSPR
jgi:hypothetical protein